MNLIVAVDNNWGIGNDDGLLYNIKEDMQHFKNKTTGKVVIMGDVTLFSLPGGKPLKNRINVILSSNANLKVEGAHILHNVDEVKEFIKQFDSDEVFVIGGASVYKQFLPFCKYAYITKIDAEKSAKKFFPDIDALPEWRLTEKSADHFSDGIKFNFCKYENINL